MHAQVGLAHRRDRVAAHRGMPVDPKHGASPRATAYSSPNTQ
jgi:hypothetical protein